MSIAFQVNCHSKKATVDRNGLQSALGTCWFNIAFFVSSPGCPYLCPSSLFLPHEMNCYVIALTLLVLYRECCGHCNGTQYDPPLLINQTEFLNGTGNHAEPNVPCPGGKKVCPPRQTCCLHISGFYGCCPVESGRCCNDYLHCCESGTICDMARTQCVKP